MAKVYRYGTCLAFLLVVALVLSVSPSQVQGYVEAPHSLGQIVNLSTHIVLMQVESIDREKNLIIYRKLRDLKGKHPQEVLKHNIGRAGFHEREWKIPMAWAEVGKTAIFFHNGSASETCIGMYWYQCYPGGEWWNHSHGEPFLLRTFAGRVDKLATAVTEMLEGREVVVPCMIDGNKDDLHLQRAKIYRSRASLKLADFNPKRDFVGWGGEDFRRLNGMPGFTHFSGLSRVDPDAQSISCPDLDADGKLDLCLAGAGKVAILQNGGEAMSEISIPGATGGRAAVWADYNGDGLPDLLLATGQGPRLYTNQGKGVLREDSHLLPTQPAWNLTAAAWIDQNGDGRPDLLLGNGFHGLHLYRNLGPTEQGKQALGLGDWYYIGPFSNEGMRGFATVYPPETEIDLKKSYKGKGDREVKWQPGKFNDGEVNNLAILPDNNDVAIYLYREIESDRARDLPTSFGSDDTLTVWLNGKKIISENSYRAAAPDQHQVILKLQPGTNRLLLKICQGNGDFAFYFKAQAKTPPVTTWNFKDVSEEVGLGANGIGSTTKGNSLSVFDANGDGRQDFLYSTTDGLLLALHGRTGFRLADNSGLADQTSRVGPALADWNGDGAIDLLLPQEGTCKLFQNNGQAQFTEMSEKVGLSNFPGRYTSAGWGDVDNDGNLDLVLGCIGTPNRYLRNRGDGTFEDASEAIGLNQRIFNTQAICLADLNNDGMLDMIFNNEGQDSCVLLGNPEFAQSAKRTPVSVSVISKLGVIGSTIRLLDAQGKLLGNSQVSGGEGRGGQLPPLARFALQPGQYKIEVIASNGEKREKLLQLANTPLRIVVD